MHIKTDSAVSRFVRYVVLAACACMAVALLASCTPGAQEKDPAQLNREYMSSVNRISNEASEALADFGEAAGKGDLAAMRVAAADAGKKLEKISGLTAPEALADVHSEYQSGAQSLSEALSAYIDVYGRALNLDTEDAKVQAEVESALKEVRVQYENAVKHLALADEKVAEFAGGEDGEDAQGASDAATGDAADAGK